MSETPWDIFFKKAVAECLQPEADVLDIGSGLRVDASRGNVVDPKRSWIRPMLEHVNYQVMDPVGTYHPDIIGDVMHMPFANAAWDVVFCLAVLEHVQRPWDAMKEIQRVLKPGGRALLYVPFLSPYHAMPGYYGDYFRFTEDGIRSLCAEFSSVEICPVRGPIETLTHLLPGNFGHELVRRSGRFLDRFRHGSGKQVSGYYYLVHK
jgi:ubiquinone/menaquinone biosynthesis C-methylase UbiE